MARRKGLVGPVKMSLAALPAGAFRVKHGTSLGRPDTPQLQEVKAAVERGERLRVQPVKQSESSVRH